MRFLNAIKAFFKALTDPSGAIAYLEGTSNMPNETSDPSHLRLLALLQQSSRWIDFLKEDISHFSDAQIGAVVRSIHADCGKTIEELVTVRPVLDENEGSSITIAAGYDPSQIKIVGKILGNPPFKGIVIHKGWKAHKKSLPKKSGEQASDIIAPAEIEVQ